MTTKTEKIEQEVLQELAELQQKTTKSVSTLGEIHLRRREIDREVNRLQEVQTTVEADVDTINQRFNEIINELRTKYPNGEINLQTGEVTITEE